jgi:branched-chain amino acid transport system permease protein
LLYRTRVGVAMRACVDDRSLAMLNGARPDNVAKLSWAVGTSLAALAGVLIAPTLQLSALPLTLLVIDAYAAAIIGRLRSLPMTVVGALILGLANDFAIGYVPRIHAGAQYLSGLVASIPVIILFIVLLLLPQSRLRGHRTLRTREVAALPTWRGTVAFGAAIVLGTAMISTVVSKSDLFNLNRIWGIGIIGLSMIPLVGYSGQISLCQLSFGGIGMVVAAHLGAHGNPLALLWAALIAGAVGAVVALPALRLSGIYLALGTGAFAVLMDRWIFQLPAFTIFGHKFDLFQSGSLTVPAPRFFGIGLGGPKALFIFGAVMFALLSLVVVGVRRSDYGQRLLALKDSPAACATLGLNPTFTRLSVFALSAAIAGVGGAIYGVALHAVDASLLDFFTGLAILMLMVIGGVTTLGGALFTGIFLGAPILANVFPSLRQLQTVLVGVAGVGLGKNPNGFIVNDIRPRWNVLLEERGVLGGVVAALAGAWVLRATHVLTNWPYAIVTLAILAVAPTVGAVIHHRRVPEGEHIRVTHAEALPDQVLDAGGTMAIDPADVVVGPDGRLSGPLEWLGITQPYSESDMAVMDRVLALPAIATEGTSGAA